MMALTSRPFRAYLRLSRRISFVVRSSSCVRVCCSVPVTDEDNQGKAVTELVRTGRGLGGIGAGHFVQQPVRGGAKALLVLLTVEKIMLVLVFFQGFLTSEGS